MHSARHLMLIDICIKFREYSLSGFQVIERTRFVTDRQTDGQPGKNNMSPDPEGGRHNYGHSLGAQNFGIQEHIEAFPVGTRLLVPMK